MSAQLATANPRRIKASHRRRRNLASGHRIYILNNPLSGTDPTGYTVTCGTTIKPGDICETTATKTERDSITHLPTKVTRTYTVVNNGGVGYATEGTGLRAFSALNAMMSSIGGSSSRGNISGPGLSATPMRIGVNPGAFCARAGIGCDDNPYLYNPNEPSGLAKFAGDIIGSFGSADHDGYKSNYFTHDWIASPQEARENAAVALLTLLLPAARVEDAVADGATAARNALADSLAPLRGRAPATVTGGYNLNTGEFLARACGGGKCAEDHVAEALGGNKADIRFTSAIRPRTGEEVPVCPRCEATYGRDAFAPGTKFKTDEQ